MGQIFSVSTVLAAASIFVARRVGMKIAAPTSDFIGSTFSYLPTTRPPPAPEDIYFVEDIGYLGLKARFDFLKLIAGNKFETVSYGFISYGRPGKKRFFKVKITVETECHPILIPMKIMTAWAVDVGVDVVNHSVNFVLKVFGKK